MQAKKHGRDFAVELLCRKEESLLQMSKYWGFVQQAYARFTPLMEWALIKFGPSPEARTPGSHLPSWAGLAGEGQFFLRRGV